MKKNMNKKRIIIPIVIIILLLLIIFPGRILLQNSREKDRSQEGSAEIEIEMEESETEDFKAEETESEIDDTESNDTETEEVDTEEMDEEDAAQENIPQEPITYSFDPSWEYAGFSKINSGTVTLYSASENRKNYVVAVNAGHGTSGGSSVKTQCHPDGSAKVTGGSTAQGSTYATAVAGGATLLDGTSEADVTLALAQAVKEELLANGYDVLMIRDGSDVQLDNIARTVFANQLADCHIALHYDSTTSDKGAFYISTPDVTSYRNMEPVKSHWQEHHRLGEALISGMRNQGISIYSSGSIAIDLTQTSYSTIPSIDLEVGDRASDHANAVLQKLAAGIVEGVSEFTGNIE